MSHIVTNVWPARRDDPRALAIQRLREERLARVRKVIGAKVFDAQVAEFHRHAGYGSSHNGRP